MLRKFAIGMSLMTLFALFAVYTPAASADSSRNECPCITHDELREEVIELINGQGEEQEPITSLEIHRECVSLFIDGTRFESEGLYYWGAELKLLCSDPGDPNDPTLYTMRNRTSGTIHLRGIPID